MISSIGCRKVPTIKRNTFKLSFMKIIKKFYSSHDTNKEVKT